ncbi:MAG: hypothetical protein JW947_04160 [Sedimentisphaerales bacterium]|nr:hypothetical protein [Sedimentisphaerales bacterium]
MKFSERMGIKPVADVIQVDGMNNELRNSIWNALYAEEFGKHGFLNEYGDRFARQEPRIEAFSESLWADYFKLPVDNRPHLNAEILKVIREYFFSCSWDKVYDFVEFCVAYYGERLVAPLNSILERELAGYRIIDGKIAPISSTEEVETIQTAIGDNTFPGASAHLKSALDLLSRKTNPDYRNSIKESISAVESVSCAITGSTSTTLGEALKELTKKQSLHGALKDGFLKLYGYTSDSDGIRHAMLEESQLTQADAVYFLVSCSAFVNYLKSKIAG